MKRLGIVADDLTGAGDIGGMFLKFGYAVRVLSLDAPLPQGRTDVLVIDTDSRFDAPEVAAAKVKRATRTLQDWGADAFWKKTCSVFRGNVGAEFDALLEAVGKDFGVVVAAFPKNGRRTKNGVHTVHGKPLEHSEFASDPVHPRTRSNLVEELQSQTTRPVHQDPDRKTGYLLCDAETQEDLARLAERHAGEPVFLGSSALAEELARIWPRPEPFFEPPVPAAEGPTLVVAGSVMPQTAAQLQALGAPWRFVTLSGRDAMDGKLDQDLSGEFVVLQAETDAVEETRRLGAERGLSATETSRRVSEALAEMAARTGARKLVVLGGDTSAAVCRRLGIVETLLLKEIAPGLPSSLSEQGHLLVLKSGSFGAPDFVTRASRHLEKWGFKKRARELVARMTLKEKVAQLQHNAPAIERLDVPAHNYWNECLHGVARAGEATVFPQAIGLAATWNVDLMHRVACCISDEARAKHHDFASRGSRQIYQGLTFWSPNINLYRDPRWGRGQETYGEDPTLTGKMAVAFVRGLQGEHPRYWKLVSTPKHFAVHSGPEALRHEFDADCSDEDLWGTYLPHFRAAVVEAGAESIMTAYSRFRGEPCSSHPFLLQQVLREEWGFEGFVVSDCDAVRDIHAGHKTVETPAQAAARALKAGCDLECGCTYAALEEAVGQGHCSEADLDRALERVMTARFQLGMFDPGVDYQRIPLRCVDSEEHRGLALEAARQSIVLLKNDGLLPLDPGQRLAVIGPVTDHLDVLLGNYNGVSSRHVTLRQGLPQAGYAAGCELCGESADFSEALEVAREADVVVLCLGHTPKLEGEEMDAGDRPDLALPGQQERLLQAVLATGKPCVLVLTGGGCQAGDWDKLNAILAVWYPGEEGGTALADVLFGNFNPCGKLPVTFYRDAADLPPFEDYSMANRTYRFFEGQPLWWFGHGLSYTRFETRVTLGERVRVEVGNVGERTGAEVVQLYAGNHLRDFRRVELAPGEWKAVEFARPPGEIRIGPRR